LNNFKNAMTVLKIFKKHEFEAFIVGGAVRDYLLKMPYSDIDITTNAKPEEVMKFFKSAPTGLKYGTVTIFFNDFEYEVTTYRSDGEYLDSRHPESVEFMDDVIEDVKRRDFTINSMLMDLTGKIHDHFGGMKDIKYKIIKTVGNPIDRFNEDALRMLRAFYFQAKLGFELDKETEDAILNNRHLIQDISAERVLNEVIKMIQAPNLKLALSKMLDTKVAEVLPGLEKGIKHFVKMDEMPYVDVFFATAFALEGRVPSYWKFSNQHRNRYEKAVEIVNKELAFDGKTLYLYGLEISLLANRVLYALGKDLLRTNEITNDFNNLPINSSLDLKVRGKSILNITNRKAGAWVNKLTEEMVMLVLDGKLKNNKTSLEEFVLNNFERF